MHSHYWLSGQVGALARDRWGVPLVHSMHTMAKVKNAALAEGDTPEPLARVIGEEQVVEAADMLIANTDIEAKQLIELYDADPGRVEVVHPGVDLDVFRPVAAAEARAGLGLPVDADVLLFAGRIQPLKAPDVLLHAVAELLARSPERRSSLVVPIVGGPVRAPASRSRRRWPTSPPTSASPTSSGSCPPVDQRELARWYAAATAVAVPSYNESFGLVAAEAQATGTPVVAAAVGGLTTVVRDGRSGLLVDGHDPRDWATALTRVLDDRDLRDPARGRRAGAGAAVLLGGHRRPHPRGLRARCRAASASRHDATRRSSSATTSTTTRSSSTSPAMALFSFTLPGEKKLQTAVRLDVGRHALGVHAFVCRRPDENHERVYRVAAPAQPQAVRRRVRHRPRSATSTSTPGFRWPPSRPTSSTGCSARC